jgi:hypothetical protein
MSLATVGGSCRPALFDQPFRRATTPRPDFAPVDRGLQSYSTASHFVRGGVSSAHGAPQAPPRAQLRGFLLIGWLEQYRTRGWPMFGNGDPGVATAQKADNLCNEHAPTHRCGSHAGWS